jgi:Family of unknown function (DUF6175)
MKKQIALLSVLLVFMISGFAQKYEKTGRVVLLSESDSYLVVSSAGYYAKKNKSEIMRECEVNAFEQLMFNGITGFNNDDPLIFDAPKARGEHADYFRRFFSDGRYKVFVSATDMGDVQKTTKKEFMATSKVTIYIKALINDLTKNNMIREFGVGDVPNTAQPTIMVIPYKTDQQTFKDIIQNDFDKRIAIAKVQEGFNGKGFQTIDFEAKLNAALRANQFEANSQSSLDKQLIRSSGSDIYVTVDIKKSKVTNGSRVNMTLKAYETSSGKVLASSSGNPLVFRTSQFDQLCKLAVEAELESFLAQIDKNFKKADDKGNTVVLNMSILNGSSYTFDSEIGEMSFPFSDVMRMWVKKNSFNRNFHLQGVVETSMIFDLVQIPLVDQNGNQYTQNDFAFDIFDYINNTLQIPCKKRVDGNTIYITVQ